MNINDLRTAWRAEMEQGAPIAELRVDLIKREVSEVQRVVHLRDCWMILLLSLSAVGVPLIRWLNGDGIGHLSQLGMIAFAIASALAVSQLLGSRKVTGTDDWTLRARLESEIGQLEQQRGLGERIGSWFLGPMAPAIVLLSLGGYHDRTGSYAPSLSLWLYYLLCAAVFAIVYGTCRRAAHRRVDPLLSRLRQLQHELLVDHDAGVG
jgi:hypothetical protein